MSSAIDHLAELTGLRDRDVLDVSLVGALRDLLQPREVAIHRVVGDAADPRWMTRARLSFGDVSAQADSLWADLQSLPALNEHADWASCLLRQEPFTRDGEPARAFFPLANDLEAVGVLELQTDRPLQPEQVRMVDSILRVFRNFQGLLDYSERDTLTGLLNRKTFDESFMRALAGASDAALASAAPAADDGRRADPLRDGGGRTWLGVIDIDHFKRVNDGFGHLIGDEVLLLMSRLMRGTFRFHDHLFRFGGEEFVVLMRCSHDADALGAFERLRSNVECFAFPQVGRITVSVGFTGLRSGDTPSSAFERADKAVYWAKQHGRNQVAHHADLVARGELVEAAIENRDAELF